MVVCNCRPYVFVEASDLLVFPVFLPKKFLKNGVIIVIVPTFPVELLERFFGCERVHVFL